MPKLSRAAKPAGSATPTLSRAALLAALAAPAAALAEDRISPAEDAPPPAEEDQPDANPVRGFSLGISAGSAYNARGLNLYQSDRQRDPHAYLMPSLTWSPPGTGLSLGWLSAFQLNGARAGTHIAQGISAEQDFFASYTRSLPPDGLSATASLALLTYPFATQDDAGAEVPICAEPSLSLSYAGAVDASLTVLYSHGVQATLSEARHLYLNPKLGKTLALGARLSLSGTASFGIKTFGPDGAPGLPDNTLDASLSLSAPLAAAPGLVLRPSLNWAWTNLSAVTLAEEQFVWGQLDASYSF